MKYSLTMGSGRSRINLLYGSQIRKVGSAKNMRFFLFFFFLWKTKNYYRSVNEQAL